MKKIIFLMLLVTISVGVFAQQKYQRYTTKSGYIEYKLTGNTTGTKKMWWDDYGNKSRTEVNSVSVTKMFGITNETKEQTVSVTNGTKFWSANLIEKTGTKGTYSVDEQLAFYEKMTEPEKRAFEKKMLESYGGSIVGKETIMGYECEIVSIMGAKSWVYRGVVLKTEASILGITITETAVVFDKNITVPASKFEPYPGINYEDMGEIEVPVQVMVETTPSTATQPVVNPPKFSCSYETFEKMINSVKLPGYKMITVNNSTTHYNAVFISFGGTLTLMASSKDQLTRDLDVTSFESFQHNGKNHYFGTDENSSFVIVDYKDQGIYILFIASPEKSKASLLQMTDKFVF
jgi:hypothetical protein